MSGIRFLLSAVALMSSAAGAAEPASLGKLAVAPDSFKGQQVTVDASIAMIVTQKILSQCKKKEKGAMIIPPIVDGKTQPMGSTQVQACMDEEAMLKVVDLPPGSVLSVTGTVRIVRSVGIIEAIVLDGSTVVVKPPTEAVSAPATAQ